MLLQCRHLRSNPFRRAYETADAQELPPKSEHPPKGEDVAGNADRASRESGVPKLLFCQNSADASNESKTNLGLT
jgi:hypothetical protein